MMQVSDDLPHRFMNPLHIRSYRNENAFNLQLWKLNLKIASKQKIDSKFVPFRQFGLTWL